MRKDVVFWWEFPCPVGSLINKSEDDHRLSNVFLVFSIVFFGMVFFLRELSGA